MTRSQASQIAELLNARNKLTRQYDADRVLKCAENYCVRESADGKIIGCVEVKLVQWYQAEILHLSVAEAEGRKGLGSELIREAEALGVSRNARLIQCTISEANNASRCFFLEHGYVQVSRFKNTVSGNNVTVWQKVLSVAS